MIAYWITFKKGELLTVFSHLERHVVAEVKSIFLYHYADLNTVQPILSYAVMMRVKTDFCVANKNLVDNDSICMYCMQVMYLKDIWH